MSKNSRARKKEKQRMREEQGEGSKELLPDMSEMRDMCQMVLVGEVNKTDEEREKLELEEIRKKQDQLERKRKARFEKWLKNEAAKREEEKQQKAQRKLTPKIEWHKEPRPYVKYILFSAFTFLFITVGFYYTVLESEVYYHFRKYYLHHYGDTEHVKALRFLKKYFLEIIAGPVVKLYNNTLYIWIWMPIRRYLNLFDDEGVWEYLCEIGKAKISRAIKKIASICTFGKEDEYDPRDDWIQNFQEVGRDN